MIHYDEKTNECKIRYGQDSNGNEVNIFLLVPQYVVITIGEVSYLMKGGVLLPDGHHLSTVPCGL